MTTILVTGANGLLARGLVARLAIDHEVHATTHAEPVERVRGVRYLRADLAADDVTSRLPARVDVVVHLAQSSNYRRFPEMAPDIFAVNTASTARLLDHAQRGGAKQFVYFSTGGLYEPGPREVSEESPIVPLASLNYHFASKLGGEALVNCYARLMHTVVVRPFFIWGRGQRRSMFLPRLADQIRKRDPIFLDGDEGIRVNPIHAEDASSFVTQLINSELSGTYNMAGPEVVTIKAISDTIGGHLGIEPTYARRETEPLDLYSSTRKMAEAGCRPSIRIADRIADIVEP